jgi:hypothetical protein
LKREVKQLLRLAERADVQDIADGMSIPQKLARRESRLAAIAEAKSKIEARPAKRLARANRPNIKANSPHAPNKRSPPARSRAVAHPSRPPAA